MRAPDRRTEELFSPVSCGRQVASDPADRGCRLGRAHGRVSRDDGPPRPREAGGVRQRCWRAIWRGSWWSARPAGASALEARAGEGPITFVKGACRWPRPTPCRGRRRRCRSVAAELLHAREWARPIATGVAQEGPSARLAPSRLSWAAEGGWPSRSCLARPRYP